MSNNKTADNYELRLKQIFKQYTDIICPFIAQLETQDNEYPVEILNEIRAVFTHLSRYELSSVESDKLSNLESMEGHIKRATLDCFKYLCISYDDKFKTLLSLYKDIDMSLVDNGEFLPKITDLLKKSQNTYQEAKKLEIKLTKDSINLVYKKYEQAYNYYSDLISLFNDAIKKLDRLKLRAMRKKRFEHAGMLVGIIGIIATIVSVIIPFLC